jgi:2-dehydro-3-deoxygluconokinase
MRVITFGEIMLRFAPEGYNRLFQTPVLNGTFGGGEANVAVSLSNFGVDAGFVTKLPDNAIADACVRELRGFGVDVRYIARGGERMGVYYMEKGASCRPSNVIYDRAHSSISTAVASDFDWDKIFDGADWFHFTGITPALSDELANITLTAVKVAKSKGLSVSCDLNYRKKLWTREKAGMVMSTLMPYVDLCICNEEDAKDVFNIVAEGTDIEKGSLSRDGYKGVAQKLVERFGFKKVAITLRESFSANDNDWSAMLYDGVDAYFSNKYSLHIVDRVGGGDSFGAGLIYGFVNGFDNKSALEFAVAASALKHTIEGDFNRVGVKEVESLLKNGGSGRVQR